MKEKEIVVIILTYNSEKIIKKTITRAKKISLFIFIVFYYI